MYSTKTPKYDLDYHDYTELDQHLKTVKLWNLCALDLITSVWKLLLQNGNFNSWRNATFTEHTIMDNTCVTEMLKVIQPITPAIDIRRWSH